MFHYHDHDFQNYDPFLYDFQYVTYLKQFVNNNHLLLHLKCPKIIKNFILNLNLFKTLQIF